MNALVYYGVFLSAPAIGGSFYLNFFLTSLIELPAIPVGVWVFNRLVISFIVNNYYNSIILMPFHIRF